MTSPTREALARIIDPSSWRVMDSYLAEVKRRPNCGYDPDAFKDKASLALADRVLTLFQPLAEENRKLRETLQLIAGQTPHNHNSKADPDREHYLRSVLISLAKTALQPQGQGGAS